MSEQQAQKKSASREFTAASFFWRLAAALVLVLATYNPSGVSFFHWVAEAESLGPEHFVVGVLIAIGWVILIAATKRSLNALGMILGIVLLGGIVWLLIDLGALSVESTSALTWVLLICIAVLLAVGLSWSHIWRRLTGQFEVDDN